MTTTTPIPSRPSTTTWLAGVVALAILAGSIAGLVPTFGRPRAAVGTAATMGAERVSWVTGEASASRTDLGWNVHGTDLGHPVLHRGSLYLVFGDTWGRTGIEGSDWRSSTMAKVASPDPRHGLMIESMVTTPDGEAAELLPSLKIDGVEKTVIPTHAISVGDRLVLHHMSVRRWLGAGRWEVSHAGFAVSDDVGATWSVSPESLLAGDGGFAQVAMVAQGDHVLIFGIPAGRHGPVRLARSDPATLHLPATHEHWTGSGWDRSSGTGRVLVDGPVGELSVQWNQHLQRWLMMYLDPGRDAIVIRTAVAPTGPWSEPTVVTSATAHPQLYAPYIIPGTDTGSDLYFTMSQFGPYQVALMRTSLEALEGLGPT
ncbi:MAG: DUF4185 domain-containing protein [Acidimicrobiales bacterium]